MIHWLLRIAGPIVRYRVLADIVNEQDVGVIARVLRDMLESPVVVDWLSRLQPDFDFNAIHSGRQNAYENVMGKLTQLGLRAGLQPFDNRTLPFRVLLSEYSEDPEEVPFAVFIPTILASFLSYAGYGSTKPVLDHLKSRLDSLYEFAKYSDFESIYVDKARYKGIPKSYSSHRLVDPDLNKDQQFRLPWIHDIRGIAYCKPIMDDSSLRTKAESVVKMTLRDEYQRLPWGYGITKYAKRYYAIGWSVHLPGYFKRPEGREFGEMLLTLETMASFDCIRSSRWFKQSMDYLDEFRTEDGTLTFPRTWLPERKRGYWVGGEYLAFDERKENVTAIECESTFRYLVIQKQADLLRT